MLAARTFSVRSRRVPAWVGLLALFEDFILTWDPVRDCIRTGAATDELAEALIDSRVDGSTGAQTHGSTGARVSPAAPKRPGDPVYSSAGWRCTAPC